MQDPQVKFLRSLQAEFPSLATPTGEVILPETLVEDPAVPLEIHKYLQQDAQNSDLMIEIICKTFQAPLCVSRSSPFEGQSERIQ